MFQGGKEILIKVVVMFIPNFTMSCFKLPDRLCDELEQLMVRFWWGQQKDEKKIQRVGWKQMCQPKREEGLGFKDLKKFNLAY